MLAQAAGPEIVEHPALQPARDALHGPLGGKRAILSGVRQEPHLGQDGRHVGPVEAREVASRDQSAVGPAETPDVPRTEWSVEPSAWMRRKSAACARLAIRALSRLPFETQHVLCRVMITCSPSARSSVRSRNAIRSTTDASDCPVTTPCVPPPSLILSCEEPGPIGSKARFG